MTASVKQQQSSTELNTIKEKQKFTNGLQIRCS